MTKLEIDKSIFKIFGVMIIIIILGISLGLYYSSLPQHHPQENQQNCESISGQWVENACIFSE